MKQPAIYIMTSKRNGALYIGVTSDLSQRTYEHKHGIVPGFTKLYQVDLLVYFEMAGNMLSAITREKQLKKWHREWKIRLIEESNPYWNDLYESIL